MYNRNRSIGKWISALNRHRRNFISKRLEPYGISCGQDIILLGLYHLSGASQEKIADYLKIDKTTVAKSVKKLECDGYVARDIDAEDKRAYRVYLTSKALGVIPVITDAMEQWDRLISSGIAEEETKKVEDILTRMVTSAYRENEAPHPAGIPDADGTGEKR